MSKKTLTPDNRQFFSLVASAAFANPFSPERADIDSRITGLQARGQWRKIVPEVIAEVARRIEPLDRKAPTTLSDFNPSDADIMRHVFLFDVFHQFAKHIEDLIEKQIIAGDKPLPVPFAQEVIDKLFKRGFSRDECIRFIALFYQIRRAFHFIDLGLVGKSSSMQLMRMNLWNNIFTHDIRNYESCLWDRMEDFSTLFLGPTGCGKGAAAAAIGRSGFIAFDEKTNSFAESFTSTFIPINLSQYAETLLESELFGHTKGAFTGAVATHEGLFALAGRHGSIFLDEIGEISTQIQIKLLRVLEERIFSPIGSHKKCRFHGRVIAATNKSIDALRTEGKFRDDFYYRLCSDCITVPSLKQKILENPEELNELIAHSVKIITGEESERLTAEVMEVIKTKLPPDYNWPGNVRELAQCVRRIIIKRDYEGDTVGSHSLKDQLFARIDSHSIQATELLEAYCNLLYQSHPSYQTVSNITGLDRRTVKKYIENFQQQNSTLVK